MSDRDIRVPMGPLLNAMRNLKDGQGDIDDIVLHIPYGGVPTEIGGENVTVLNFTWIKNGRFDNMIGGFSVPVVRESKKEREDDFAARKSNE